MRCSISGRSSAGPRSMAVSSVLGGSIFREYASAEMGL